MASQRNNQAIDHLFRTEYGKLLATLTRVFGPSYIQMAEDMVQETLISALDHWSVEGVPENPAAWLFQVARRKVLNEIKRNKMQAEHYQKQAYLFEKEEDIGQVFMEDEIHDSQLRMIFTCCHPSINRESQIALTLKTLCGFGIREVANALLSNETTINKRLYRAKKTIRESQLPFAIPQGKELENRLETVSLTLYLLFNEGYNSSLGNSTIKKELCLEAMRLCKLMIHQFPEHKRLYALLSLMCFHAARFDARIDHNGALILFEDQDRSSWNRELINHGILYLGKSSQGSELSAYHIEANIAAEHCMASSFDTTNWPNLYKLYQLLEKLKPNPIISLNLAIIQSQTDGVEASLESIKQLRSNTILAEYHLLPATQAVLEMKLGRFADALKHLYEAQSLNPPFADSGILKSKVLECQESLKEQNDL